jgi:TolB protein
MPRRTSATAAFLLTGCAALLLATTPAGVARSSALAVATSLPPGVGQGSSSASGQQQPTAQQQPQDLELTIKGGPGSLPHIAVPDFIALSSDADTAATAKAIAEVLWDDLNFEREYDMVPRDTYASIPASRSMSDVPFDRWRELGVDGLVVGTVMKTGDTLRVEVRLFRIAGQKSVFGKEYTGSAANPRIYAHTIADEIYQTQSQLRGVARTKLAFASDRDDERVGGTVEQRNAKEIYICDYDAANQRPVTINRKLNITPAWSPDGRSLAYTSYRRGYPDLFISNIYQTTPPEEPAHGQGQNFLPAWSPDGTRIAFMSTRDGNPEIYIMNRDGSGVRRLTNSPAIDVTPTWAPSGAQIAFVSDRSGSPQIYVVGVDGVGLRRITSESYCDRPTWSPAPFNEIAYTSRTGGGIHDIKVMDMATLQVRQLTFGEGSSESPAFAPNGRHIAFSSTRSGKRQIYTIARTGKDLRQITKLGNNEMPDWSK